MLLPHIKAISISHVESVHCNTDFLHLTHITRVNLFLFAFKNIYLGKKIKEEEKKKKKERWLQFCVRGLWDGDQHLALSGYEQTVSSAAWRSRAVLRPDRKGAPASRRHER